MGSSYISYKSSTIHYAFTGVGDRVVICFHGYGEDATHFRFLEDGSEGNFTFIGIDLPFHGKTDWKEGMDFSVFDLLAVLNQVFEKSFSPAQVMARDVILLGFSMGARVALRLYQAEPEKFSRLVLLAPDGLRANIWYWVATQTWAGNRLFAFTLKHPGWFTGLLRLLNRMRLVNSSIFKFVNYYTGNREVCRLLYARWTTLRRIKPSVSRIRSLVNQYATPVRLLYGKHDRIISPERGTQFRKGMENNCTVAVLDCGHQVLHPKNAVSIIEALIH